MKAQGNPIANLLQAIFCSSSFSYYFLLSTHFFDDSPLPHNIYRSTLGQWVNNNKDFYFYLKRVNFFNWANIYQFATLLCPFMLSQVQAFQRTGRYKEYLHVFKHKIPDMSCQMTKTTDIKLWKYNMLESKVHNIQHNFNILSSFNRLKYILGIQPLMILKI